ncbi:hypothetical protein Y032_0002g918 [Ancylostoma ceylanicum]|uniref:Uncharacterized protein n=1 Tax=Ancylostoma ceylanicum TaxID=53326 RepID=A0A016W248_9BILA|nr:hypothetical protein Y032_0002g918 [Ancylostoma ceylanicum]
MVLWGDCSVFSSIYRIVTYTRVSTGQETFHRVAATFHNIHHLPITAARTGLLGDPTRGYIISSCKECQRKRHPRCVVSEKCQ